MYSYCGTYQIFPPLTFVANLIHIKPRPFQNVPCEMFKRAAGQID